MLRTQGGEPAPRYPPPCGRRPEGGVRGGFFNRRQHSRIPHQLPLRCCAPKGESQLRGILPLAAAGRKGELEGDSSTAANTAESPTNSPFDAAHPRGRAVCVQYNLLTVCTNCKCKLQLVYGY